MTSKNNESAFWVTEDATGPGEFATSIHYIRQVMQYIDRAWLNNHMQENAVWCNY